MKSHIKNVDFNNKREQSNESLFNYQRFSLFSPNLSKVIKKIPIRVEYKGNKETTKNINRELL